MVKIAKKSSRTTKSLMFKLRMSPFQKQVLMLAAERDGSSMSSWLLQAGLRAAREQLA